MHHITTMSSAHLPRRVFRLSGEGVGDWLAGLLTNELSAELTFAALLTPQGKIIADLFVHHEGEAFLLETPMKFADDLFKRLRMYRLRKPIEIEATELKVYAIWDATHPAAKDDPRLPALGQRLLTEKTLDASDDYDSHRLSLGVPDSQWDFESVTTFPADANMDLLNGVNFSKGCFVGQEVVSRMKRMTTVKKRMRGITLSGDATAGDRLLCGERVVGDVLHVNGRAGMAMIRLDRLRSAEVSPTVNGERVKVMMAVDGQDH